MQPLLSLYHAALCTFGSLIVHSFGNVTHHACSPSKGYSAVDDHMCNIQMGLGSCAQSTDWEASREDATALWSRGHSHVLW